MNTHRTRIGILRFISGSCVLLSLVITPTYAQKVKSPSAKRDTMKVLALPAEVQQERKENDKLLPQEEIDRVLAGTRGFDADRHSVFTASEQSKIMEQISEYAGVPYAVGGDSKDGVDCGSFVALVYKNATGLELPRTSTDQFYHCPAVPGNEAHFGDLVFFNTTGQHGSHVGIYIGNRLFAHASVSIGVTISTLESTYYKNRFEGVRRLPRNE